MARVGRRTKIEENYGTNLGLTGMKLLQEAVNDENIDKLTKLKLLEPYLTKMIPTMVKIDDQRLSVTDRTKAIECITSLRQLLSETR